MTASAMSLRAQRAHEPDTHIRRKQLLEHRVRQADQRQTHRRGLDVGKAKAFLAAERKRSAGLL